MYDKVCEIMGHWMHPNVYVTLVDHKYTNTEYCLFLLSRFKVLTF